MFGSRTLSILASLLFVSSLGLARGPKLPAPDPERGSLGITIEAKPPAKIGKMSAIQVYFVRLDQGEDPSNAESVIPSNYSARDQVYLLNAKPGRYVAVAAQLQGVAVSNLDFHAFLSKETILQTEVTVVPERMAFMGRFSVQTSTKMEEADPAQSHYYRIILPSAARKGFMGRALSGAGAYTARLTSAAKDAQTVRAFWVAAIEKVFKAEPSWQDVVRREMDSPKEDEIYEAVQAGDLGKGKALLVKQVLEENSKLVNAEIANLPLLHLAASHGRKDLVELLLAGGADVNASNQVEVTPLHLAAVLDHTNVVEFLLSKGANVNAEDKVHGLTVLHFVVSVGSKDMADLLLANGAHINARAKNGATPLYSAALNGRKDTVELLLSKGADVNAADNLGLTAVDVASLEGFTEVATVLRRHGAKK